MRSFRARIERGRIIVHEPIDLPDGVVFLVAVEPATASREDCSPEADVSRAAPIEPPPDQRSSS